MAEVSGWWDEAFAAYRAYERQSVAVSTGSWSYTMPAFAAAADSADTAFGGVRESVEAALWVSHGLRFPGVESMDWALRKGGAQVRADIKRVQEYWHETRVHGGTFDENRPGVVASMRRYPVDRLLYVWIPSGLDQAREKAAARGRTRQTIDPEVRKAEERLKGVVAGAETWQRIWDSSGHLGPIETPSDSSEGDYSCAKCGAVTGDKQLFQEIACGSVEDQLGD